MDTAIAWDDLTTKERMAECKSKQRKKTARIEEFDWLEGELDLEYLKTITALAETVSDLSRACARRIHRYNGNGLPQCIVESRDTVQRLAGRDKSEWSPEAIAAIDCAGRLLDEAYHAWAGGIEEEASGGGATAAVVGTDTPSELLHASSVSTQNCAPANAREGATQIMQDIVATIFGPVGSVESSPGHRLRIKLDDRWRDVFERINVAIREGKSFVDIDDAPRPITEGGPEELETLRNVIRARSQGCLSLVPKSENQDHKL